MDKHQAHISGNKLKCPFVIARISGERIQDTLLARHEAAQIARNSPCGICLSLLCRVIVTYFNSIEASLPLFPSLDEAVALVPLHPHNDRNRLFKVAFDHLDSSQMSGVILAKALHSEIVNETGFCERTRSLLKRGRRCCDSRFAVARGNSCQPSISQDNFESIPTEGTKSHRVRYVRKVTNFHQRPTTIPRIGTPGIPR